MKKYEYLLIIQQYTEGGWEDVDADEDTRDGMKRMRENLKLYRESQPQYRHRMIHRREPNPEYVEPKAG